MEILNDFTISVEKALTEIDSGWRSYNGLIVCGTHDPKNTDKIIKQIKNARENNIPFLGICMGFQLMLIEWMRSVGFESANSAEIDPNATPKVISNLPNVRVGIRDVYWRGKESKESHWHNFALFFLINPHYKQALNKKIQLNIFLQRFHSQLHQL